MCMVIPYFLDKGDAALSRCIPLAGLDVNNFKRSANVGKLKTLLTL